MRERQPEDDYHPPHDREGVTFGVTATLIAARLWLASILHEEVAMRHRFRQADQPSVRNALGARTARIPGSPCDGPVLGFCVLAAGDNAAKSWSS
jgi:hypothetical protein